MRCGHPKPVARTAFEFLCESCGFKHFVNPIAAVVAILTNPTGDILLLRRAHDPGKGRLGLPGGFVDPGETAEEALRREVREETHLEVEDFSYFLSLPNRYPYQGLANPVLDLFYTATVKSFDAARALAEVEALVITPAARVRFAEVAFPSNEKALRLFLARRRNPVGSG